MAEMDFEKLSNKELIRKLNEGAFAHHFETGKEWKLFREALDRLASQAQYKLTLIDPIKDPTGVIECQVIAKFCRGVLKGIISGLKNEGRIAFDELNERGIKPSATDDGI